LLLVEWAGQVNYLKAWDRQKELVAERENTPDLDDYLLLLEHPPTYTLGRHGRLENLLLDEKALMERGIAYHQVDRGGDITYHGPGQLVGYPILYLERYYGRGIGRIRSYISDLEALLIQVVAAFGIQAHRLEGHPGAWVDSPSGISKIAAVGIRVTAKGISSHGFALNVNPEMGYFDGIVPCGIVDHGVTSMAEILGEPVTISKVIPHLREYFSQIFNVETMDTSPQIETKQNETGEIPQLA
jgi:lipoyl(octanoyl) transferase